MAKEKRQKTEFYQWLINQWEPSQYGTAGSYAGSYILRLEDMIREKLRISLDEFLVVARDSYSKRMDTKVSLDSPAEDSLSISLVAYELLSQLNKSSKPRYFSPKTFSNYISALPYYIAFILDTKPEVISFKIKQDEELLQTFNLEESEKRFPKKYLENIFAARLKTQDRHHRSSGFIFPMRFYATQKHFPKQTFCKRWVEQQIDGIEIIVSSKGDRIKFGTISELLFVKGSEGYDVFVTAKGKKYSVYNQNNGHFSPLVVDGLNKITLDHKVSIEKVFTSLLSEGKLNGLRKISDLIQLKFKEEGFQKLYIQYPRRNQLFNYLLDTKVLTNDFVDGLAQEFDLLNQHIKLELMHGRENSSKSNKV